MRKNSWKQIDINFLSKLSILFGGIIPLLLYDIIILLAFVFFIKFSKAFSAFFILLYGDNFHVFGWPRNVFGISLFVSQVKKFPLAGSLSVPILIIK